MIYFISYKRLQIFKMKYIRNNYNINTKSRMILGRTPAFPTRNAFWERAEEEYIVQFVNQEDI